MQFLVVGAGRSGTGYMCHLLRHNGFSCGHETIINTNVINQMANPVKQIANTNLDAESSWFAVPYLSSIEKSYPDLKLIHVWRDPVLVVKSLINIDLFNKYKNIVNYMSSFTHCDPGGDPVEFYTCYWLKWQQMILKSNNYRTIISLHSVNLEKLSEFCGREIQNYDKIVNMKTGDKRYKYDYETIKSRMKDTKYDDEINQMVKKLEKES
jgi:hypothetical protein